ncbi:hypothetical protein Taro_048903 [Colocasia esculenta]|uniref:Uncharacterized protein n=1 Tax=Colocasia esculenta TaxID=4460 RepID=A0A843X9G3_COLES|nr:hypothetical protein [Colocasia esculenta]
MEGGESAWVKGSISPEEEWIGRGVPCRFSRSGMEGGESAGVKGAVSPEEEWIGRGVPSRFSGLVSQDAECDSVLCVLVVVVLSRSPWIPFSTASWYQSLVYLLWLQGGGVSGGWLCRHLSRRLEMPRHHHWLSLDLRTRTVV